MDRAQIILFTTNTVTLPSKHFPLNKTLCSNLNCFISSFDEKLISRDTALHFKIFFGTLAAKKIVNNHQPELKIIHNFAPKNFEIGHM